MTITTEIPTQLLVEVIDRLETFCETTVYYGDDDEVGSRACCGVISYKDHSASCSAHSTLNKLKAYAPE